MHYVAALWTHLKAWCRRIFGGTTDHARIQLPGAAMDLLRVSSSERPYEITMVIPRAEFRYTQEGTRSTVEVILNGVTVVSAPSRGFEDGCREA